MTQQAFEAVTDELLLAIELLDRIQLRVPSLMLTYVGIDSMAWLNRSESHVDVQRSDFVQWAEEFLLRAAPPACTGEDLYAARCGLVHSYDQPSSLGREGREKRVWYAWGSEEATEFQDWIDHAHPESAVALDVSKFVSAFRRAVKLYKRTLYDDPAKALVVYDRAEKLFGDMPTFQRSSRAVDQ